MSEHSSARIAATPDTLTVHWAQGEVSQFAALWLRDNCPQDRDAHSGQRLIDVRDLPQAPRIAAARTDHDTVHIEWADEPRVSAFALSWLHAHAPGRARGRPERQRRAWLEGATLDARRDFCWAQPARLRSDPRARLQWLTRLLQDGIAFLEDVPSSEQAILETVPLIGSVLETNYGRTFDVRTIPQPDNLAYSDLGLGLHTDNPYREPVPGFQALHALLPSSAGGDSLFADGLALAEALRASAPEAFALLTTTALPFHYRAQDVDLYAERPLIQLAADGTISAVHYNNRSIAPLPLAAVDVAAFYRAYRHFAELLHEERYQLRTHLAAGTLVVFDNQRILHGRTAFSAAREPRHLRGCYLTRDSLYSEAALLRRRLGAA
jgi:alpha-ketoglutarate-dependent taurine dioxygenase